MKVFIWVISILGGLLIIGLITALSFIAKRSTEREEAMRVKEIEDGKFCDDDCIYCHSRQFCKVRDGYNE